MDVRNIAAVLFLAGCRLGHPAPAAAFLPGPISAAAAEPGLDEALRQQLTEALARRQILGEGSAVGISVLAADSRLVASSAAEVVYEARLSLSVTLAGPAPRQIVLSGRRTYTASDPAGAAAARAAALDALAGELADDAADWLLLSASP